MYDCQTENNMHIHWFDWYSLVCRHRICMYTRFMCIVSFVCVAVICTHLRFTCVRSGGSQQEARAVTRHMTETYRIKSLYVSIHRVVPLALAGSFSAAIVLYDGFEPISGPSPGEQWRRQTSFQVSVGLSNWRSLSVCVCVVPLRVCCVPLHECLCMCVACVCVCVCAG